MVYKYILYTNNLYNSYTFSLGVLTCWVTLLAIAALPHTIRALFHMVGALGKHAFFPHAFFPVRLFFARLFSCAPFWSSTVSICVYSNLQSKRCLSFGLYLATNIRNKGSRNKYALASTRFLTFNLVPLSLIYFVRTWFRLSYFFCEK